MDHLVRGSSSLPGRIEEDPHPARFLRCPLRCLLSRLAAWQQSWARVPLSAEPVPGLLPIAVAFRDLGAIRAPNSSSRRRGCSAASSQCSPRSAGPSGGGLCTRSTALGIRVWLVSRASRAGGMRRDAVDDDCFVAWLRGCRTKRIQKHCCVLREVRATATVCDYVGTGDRRATDGWPNSEPALRTD